MKRKRKSQGHKDQTTSSSSSSSSSAYISSLQQHGGAGDCADILFGIMLAALSKSNSDETIIKQCLHKLRLSLLKMPQTLTTIPIPIPIPILSLLPLFLNSRCVEIASTCLEIVGAASIYSFEMNEQITLDDDIIKGLLSALSSSESTVSVAAANAVLDLSTTSVGRHRLIEFSAIDNLIFCFIQAPKTQVPLVSLFNDENTSKSCLKIGFKEDEFPVLLLQAAVTLINSCTIELLEKIPIKLSESLLVYSKKLQAQVHKQMLLNTVPKYSPGRHFCMSNIRTNDLAETIVRLSIYNADEFTTASDVNEVRKSIFSLGGISFERFMLNHWEVSPVILRRQKDDIFSSFVQQFLVMSEKEEPVHSFLSSVLQNFTTCPPISWDELDVLNFLKEARDDLGLPVIDREDIRVLKTQQQSSKEMHFFEERSHYQSRFLYMDDILRCEEAFKEGYTIAVRGMELRFETIAAIADGLASLFGQPSAGVNMYLTPPNSQGLARHFDDHCVLVCQLIGVKKWTLFPRSSLLLPRLYASDSGYGREGVENLIMEDGDCKHFLLKEGDVLYIPRGFPHEACTIVENDGDVPNGDGGFSLHLTLAVEVAPPFEWEGFAHVALHHWDQNQKFTNNDSITWDLHVFAVNLMHIAIKLIGDVDPTFRKACLLGATSLPSSGWLDVNQQTIFTHLLDIINKDCRFLDALNSVEAAIINKHEDPFSELSWLNHLEGERSLNISSLILTLGKIRKIRDEAEAAFMEVKSKFCSEVLLKFKDVQHSYKRLIDKYRKVRKQYVNGMLSLHCV